MNQQEMIVEVKLLFSKKPSDFTPDDFEMVDKCSKVLWRAWYLLNSFVQRPSLECYKDRYPWDNHPPCKHIPHKKLYRDLMYGVLNIQKLMDELRQYGCGRPLVGTVNHRDVIYANDVILSYDNTMSKLTKSIMHEWKHSKNYKIND